MVRAGCVFVAGIHPSRTWTSGSFESVRWNACVHRLGLGLYSHPKEFWGKGVWTHVNSKGKIPSTGKCPQRSIEPATLWQQAQALPTELFRPLCSTHRLSLSPPSSLLSSLPQPPSSSPQGSLSVSDNDIVYALSVGSACDFSDQSWKHTGALRYCNHCLLFRLKWMQPCDVCLLQWWEADTGPLQRQLLFMRWGIVVVGWLLNVPATCECISGTDLLRQFYVLPHWDTSYRSNFPSHPVTVYWDRADQSQRWPYNTRRLAG